MSVAACRRPGMAQFATTTGNPMVDNSIKSELGALNQIFRVHPAFFILNDAVASNAFAMQDTMVSGYDGTVAFGYHLMDEEFRQSGPVNFCISAIMAHEFSHIVQFQKGSMLPVKERELQADYMAGWYIGKRQAQAIAPGSLRDSLRSFFEHGDYAFNNPSHHGTPQERTQCVIAGFKSATLSLAAIFSKSEAAVRESDSDTSADHRTNEFPADSSL